MVHSKASPDSASISHPQNPFVRLSDIAIAYIIALIFVVGVESIGVIVFAALSSESANESADDILHFGVLLFMGVVSATGFGWEIYYLVRRKYKLQWSEIGLTLDNWQRGLLWALTLFPIALLVHVLEARGWLWLIHRYSIRFLMSILDQPEYALEATSVYHMAGLCILLIVVILMLITECAFIWGLIYNALERKMSSGWSAISVMGLISFLLSPLQFVSACVITFAFTRTRTLLTPLTMTIGVSLFFQYINDVQPTWYDPNRFTMYGNCICVEDGTPLDNGVVTYRGNNYKNVTVVKWSGGRQEGKTTTTSSGAYSFQNVLPRGVHIKVTITSTHYHRHGTGASSSLKKCTYSQTQYLSDVEDVIEPVERNFVLNPDKIETP